MPSRFDEGSPPIRASAVSFLRLSGSAVRKRGRGLRQSRDGLKAERGSFGARCGDNPDGYCR
jgi:hypothetical protein